MGITAENIAEKYGITREEQDAFALESQKKAVAAVDAGKFKDEIVPVVIPNKKLLRRLPRLTSLDRTQINRHQRQRRAAPLQR